MSGKPTLAVLGAKPRFGAPLSPGQSYWPQWQRYECAARDIFARRFYTSQRFAGPLVVELQQRLCEFLGVGHVVALRNATNGLMIATHTLGLQGRVIVPAWTFIATIEALLWSKCQPVYCDIDSETQQMSIDSVRRILDGGEIDGILAVHLWAGAAPVAQLETLAHEFDVPLYCDAAHAFGCRVGGRAIGTFGRAEVFSFHSSNILSTSEGGCIATNDEELASKFTAMRGDEVSSTGSSMKSATARMSEMQAAVGLMMLDDFEKNRRNNEEQHRYYQRNLRGIAGIEILQPANVTISNFQNLVVVIDGVLFGLNREELLAVLAAENIVASRDFSPSVHLVRRLSGMNVDYERLRHTILAAQSTFQLPIGAQVSNRDIEKICEAVREAHTYAASIKAEAPLPL